MTRCVYCGREVYLTFICSYCRGSFCTDHRLPENHNCPEFAFGKRPRPTVAVNYAETKGWALRLNFRTAISSEVGQLLIAWLVLSFCFSIGTLSYPLKFVGVFSISLVTLGLGFIGHEVTHRTVAKRYGCWARFKLWWMGLFMALLFAFVSGGRIIFAAPGAVYISSTNALGYRISKRAHGIISLSGPLANLIVALFFYALTGVGGILSDVGQLGYSVNLWLAAFNLLPLGVMDGRKVFQWSPKMWATATIPIWILAFFAVIF
jgi:Zn-dependent protease